jgi:FkbM family methyltransferase
VTGKHAGSGRPTATGPLGPAGPHDPGADPKALDDVRPEVPLRDMAPLRRLQTVARWGLRQIGTRRGRRVVLRRAAFAVARSLTSVVAVDVAGEKYLVSTHDRAIGAITFSEGGLDLDLMTAALELVEARTGRALRGRTFVDVGANIGTATVPALVRFGAAGGVAVEPAPDNLELLRCNLIANELADRVVVVEAALSDSLGTALLELGESNWGDHRVRASTSSGPPRYGEDGRAVDEVRLVTFDSLVEDGTVDVSTIGVVWVDTQGHEAQVLAGAESLLTSEVPVVIEYWPYGLRRAGGLEQLHDIIASRYRTVVDLRASAAKGRTVEFPATEIGRLAAIYVGTSYTDLLLVS